MDSGTLAILFWLPEDNDGLEIAGIETTEKQDSKGIGWEAILLPVPTPGDEISEVVVFAGPSLKPFIEGNGVWTCVHKVRAPGPERFGVQQFSIAIFCAPSVPAAPPTSRAVY